MTKRVCVGLFLTLSLSPVVAADESQNATQKMNDLSACIDTHLSNEKARKKFDKSSKAKRKAVRDLVDACSVEYHAFASTLPPEIAEQAKHLVRDQIGERLRAIHQQPVQ